MSGSTPRCTACRRKISENGVGCWDIASLVQYDRLEQQYEARMLEAYALQAEGFVARAAVPSVSQHWGGLLDWVRVLQRVVPAHGGLRPELDRIWPDCLASSCT